MADIFDRLLDFPDEQFRISLKEKLMQAATIEPERPSYIPEGFRTVTPYLITAHALELMEFMKNVFGASERARYLEPSGRLMHGEMAIGDSVVELSDGSPQYPPSPAALHVYLPSVDETYVRAIAAGATTIFEPADQHYGDRAAAVRDISGNHWYLATYLGSGGYLRPGTHSVTPFLHPTDADAMIRFLVDGLSGVEEARNMDGPRIGYAKVRVGTGSVELGRPLPDGQKMTASTHVHVPDCDAVYQQALAAGGTSIHPLTDHPYGERSGGVRDPQGNQWWIATRIGPMP